MGIKIGSRRKETPEQKLARMELNMDTAIHWAYTIATKCDISQSDSRFVGEENLAKEEDLFYRKHCLLVNAFRALVRERVYEEQKKNARGAAADLFLQAEAAKLAAEQATK